MPYAMSDTEEDETRRHPQARVFRPTDNFRHSPEFFGISEGLLPLARSY